MSTPDPSQQGQNPAPDPTAHPQHGVPGQPLPGQPLPGQPQFGQPIPGQPLPGQQPLAGQSLPVQPQPGQALPGQPFPAQPVGGQALPQQPQSVAPMPGIVSPGQVGPQNLAPGWPQHAPQPAYPGQPHPGVQPQQPIVPQVPGIGQPQSGVVPQQPVAPNQPIIPNQPAAGQTLVPNQPQSLGTPQTPTPASPSPSGQSISPAAPQPTTSDAPASAGATTPQVPGQTLNPQSLDPPTKGQPHAQNLTPSQKAKPKQKQQEKQPVQVTDPSMLSTAKESSAKSSGPKQEQPSSSPTKKSSPKQANPDRNKLPPTATPPASDAKSKSKAKSDTKAQEASPTADPGSSSKNEKKRQSTKEEPKDASDTAAPKQSGKLDEKQSKPDDGTSARKSEEKKSQPAPVVHAEPEDEEEHATIDVKRSVPAWAISMVLHAIALTILGVVSMPHLFEPPVELEVLEYAEQLGDQLIDDSFQLTTDDPTIDATQTALAFENVEIETTISPDVNLNEILGAIDSISTESMDIAGPLGGREGKAKQGLLGKYGGTASTQDAVRRGLEWLAKYQRADGSWSLLGPYKDGSSANIENVAAATAMALLAFQGDGHTHEVGDYHKVMRKGWQALLKMQSRDGNFYNGNVPRQSLYTQAQCTIAVCEMYAMTGDEQFRKPAERAVEFCVRAQTATGGWKYGDEQNSDSDTSVTGWFLMALQSARMAQIDVPKECFDGISGFLDTVADPSGSRYAYMPTNYPPTPTMTAEALLCRQYLGWKRDDSRMIQGVEYLLANPIPQGDEAWKQEKNVYYWYYASQVLHHMDGKYWKEWNKVMRQAVPEKQLIKGSETGSWDPLGDEHGHIGGRLYQTCFSIYMLEVYYRHLPLYDFKVK